MMKQISSKNLVISAGILFAITAIGITIENNTVNKSGTIAINAEDKNGSSRIDDKQSESGTSNISKNESGNSSPKNTSTKYQFFKPEPKTNMDMDVVPKLQASGGSITNTNGQAMTLADVVPASDLLKQLSDEFGCAIQQNNPSKLSLVTPGSFGNDTMSICVKGDPGNSGAVIFALTSKESIKYYSNLDIALLDSPYEFKYILKSTKAIIISSGGVDSFDGEEISFNILRYKGYNPVRVILK